ncbi:MAG: hypothetical protein AAB229_04145 [Candidatus Hydrogenedentota bacterium]
MNISRGKHKIIAIVVGAAVCAAGFSMSACASAGSWSKATDHVRKGRIIEGAEAFEAIGAKSSALTASEAWYRAGTLWLDQGNPDRSYDRALECFRKSAALEGFPETVRAANTWIAVLTRLNAEQRKALSAERRAARESERLREVIRDAEKTGDALRRNAP